MTEIPQTLVEAIHHPDKNIRGQAVITLGNLGLSSLDALLGIVGKDPDFNVREDITWALVRMADGAFQPLVSLLTDTDAGVRHHAAHTLSKIGDLRAVPALIGALEDPEPAVVSKIAFTLGVFRDVRAIPPLVRLLDHSDREVQTTVVAALERFGADAVPQVLVALADPSAQVRELAADILGVIGTRANITRLASALHDDSWHVRFAVVTALGHIGGAEAKHALEPLHDDPDKRVRDLVVRLMKRIKV